MSKTLVLAEIRAEKIQDSTFELVSLANSIAAPDDDTVLLVLGDLQGDELQRCGGVNIIVAQNDALKRYSQDLYAAAIGEIFRTSGADRIIISHSSMGWDLAPRLAVELGAALVTEIIKATRSDGQLTFTRNIFGGKYLCDLKALTTPTIITAQPGAFPPEPPAGEAVVTETTLTLESVDNRTRWLADKEAGVGAVDLTKAEVVVSGGRGLGKAENFELLWDLAKMLDGNVGASRPVVDAGWLPHEHQIGSSGQRVSPKLYIALGISGAMHHLVGMKSAKTIIAVNKDPDAPIFQAADYGVVADLFEFVPALKAKIEEWRQR